MEGVLGIDRPFADKRKVTPLVEEDRSDVMEPVIVDPGSKKQPTRVE